MEPFTYEFNYDSTRCLHKAWSQQTVKPNKNSVSTLFRNHSSVEFSFFSTYSNNIITLSSQISSFYLLLSSGRRRGWGVDHGHLHRVLVAGITCIQVYISRYQEWSNTGVMLTWGGGGGLKWCKPSLVPTAVTGHLVYSTSHDIEASALIAPPWGTVGWLVGWYDRAVMDISLFHHCTLGSFMRHLWEEENNKNTTFLSHKSTYKIKC